MEFIQQHKDLLSEVFGFLDIQTILNVRLCNKYFLSIVTKDFYAFERIARERLGFLSINGFSSWFQACVNTINFWSHYKTLLEERKKDEKLKKNKKNKNKSEYRGIFSHALAGDGTLLDRNNPNINVVLLGTGESGWCNLQVPLPYRKSYIFQAIKDC